VAYSPTSHTNLRWEGKEHGGGGKTTHSRKRRRKEKLIAEEAVGGGKEAGRGSEHTIGLGLRKEKGLGGKGLIKQKNSP